MSEAWRPTASMAALRERAALLGRIRAYMDQQKVLEVETPALAQHAVTDVQLHSLAVSVPGAHRPFYLHTSPEYAMKRLLAAGSGDIYQLCKVFRGGEQSSRHNIEFTMLEWYRVGWSMQQLIDDVDWLVRAALAPRDPGRTTQVRYCEALRKLAGLDIERDPFPRFVDRAVAAGLDARTAQASSRDELLDFLVAVVVGPRLGETGPEFLTHYPASQAALAQLDAEDPRYARRFELYWRGVELANGFQELADADEQARRFEADRTRRAQLGLPDHTPDQHLLAALRAGMPPCAGVALGVDRLAMLALDTASLASVLSFTQDNA